MKKNLQLFITGLIFISACSSGENKNYPADVRQNFITSCVKSGSSEEMCSCMFEKIETRYTLKEFSTIEVKMKAGQTPAEFLEFVGKIRVECMEK